MEILLYIVVSFLMLIILILLYIVVELAKLVKADSLVEYRNEKEVRVESPYVDPLLADPSKFDIHNI